MVVSGGHGARADNRLARTTGQDDDPGAALEELSDCLLLVPAHCPTVLDEVNVVRGAGRVAREVFGGPAELHEALLEFTACPVLNADGVIAKSRTEELLHLRVAGDLAEDGFVVRAQHEPLIIPFNDEPAVAVHRFGEVERHRGWHRELGETIEGVEHFLGRVARSTRIPESETREAVRVDVLGCPLEFRKHCERVTSFLRLGMRNLEEDGAVTLDDERSVRHSEQG